MAAGAALIVQVVDLAEARQAIEIGADVIVAQGTEAGGHGGHWSTLPFVPVVVDLAAPVPVLAAGGIADGRGVAAALALGAAGALLGTRFLVALEALVPPGVPKAIIEASGEQTARSRVSDVARGAPWPARYPARTIRNYFFDQWRRPGRGASRRSGRAAGLPGRHRPRRAAAGSGLGQPGDRPDHRCVGGRRHRGGARRAGGAGARRRRPSLTAFG